MYRTSGAPAADGFGRPPALRLQRVTHQVFPAGTSRIDDGFSARHFTDIAGEYGRPYRPDLAASGAGNTFAAMARTLVESLGPEAAEVDVAIVAHATPDLDCRYAATTYLSEAWPHGPLAFGVSEQGGVTPFTALRVAAGYVRRHALRQALVLVLDQATLPYDTPGAALGGDAGVALLLSADDAPGPRPWMRQFSGVAPGEVRSLLARELGDFGEDVTVVTGAGIDPERDLPPGVARVRRAEEGYPCSALWAHLRVDDTSAQPVALAEYDPVSGDFGLCVVTRRGVPTAPVGAVR
ncbi:beta-ketoacyl-[acyl-carrier-protein] synthase family protein [Streptomyces tendae]|uniref:hypothetical protein n=1 Tax=Streptomyces tendae TaxID=1932 RepID=UPI00371660F9